MYTEEKIKAKLKQSTAAGHQTWDRWIVFSVHCSRGL